MSNTPLRFKDALDPVASTVFRRGTAGGGDRMPERLNRDEMRTPMQWDASANAGFCPDGAVPWLPVNPDYRRVNVAAQNADPDSMLHLYGLFSLRREHESLRTEVVALLEPSRQGCWAIDATTSSCWPTLGRSWPRCGTPARSWSTPGRWRWVLAGRPVPGLGGRAADGGPRVAG